MRTNPPPEWADTPEAVDDFFEDEQRGQDALSDRRREAEEEEL